MELGKHSAVVVDYGTSKTKAGNTQVFIKFKVGNEEGTWYGSPIKKDGEPNEIFFAQLANVGFDTASNDIDDLSKGMDSGILIADDFVDIIIADETAPDGELKRRIKSIGDIGPSRLTKEETHALISDEQRAKIKAMASKFKVRKKVKKSNPDEPIPF